MGKRYVTWAFVAAAALALSACGPKAGDGTSAQSAAPSAAGGGLFGGMMGGGQASYKADYKLSMGASDAGMTIYASGKKSRMENSMMVAKTGFKSVTLMDRDTMQFVTYMEGPNAPKRATKLSADEIKKFQDMMPAPDPIAKPTKIGADNVAGLSCNVWQLPAPPEGALPAGVTPPDPAEAAAARQICITDDGIMLRAGSAEKPRMIATSVEKGPQDPALFVLPAGYEVIDMGDCMAVMAQYGKAMRGQGEKPDQAKFAECQKKMMSGFAP